MKMMCRMISFLFFVLYAQAVFADTLLLRNGDQVVGTIISMNDEEIVLDVNGVPIRIYRADVTEIIRKEEPSGFVSPVQSPERIKPVTQTITSQEVVPSMLPLTSAPSMIESSSPIPLLPVVLPKGKAYQVIGAGVRFRKGPSLDYDIIQTLPGQTILIEIETIDNWLHAKTLNGLEGWIHPSFVRPMENLPCLVTGNRLQIREAPDELSRSLARLRKGDLVVKLLEQGAWWFVLQSDLTAGWSKKEFLMSLEDKNIYQPPMRIVENTEMGTPVLVERSLDNSGHQQVNFVVRNDDIVVAGKTKIILLHKDPALLTREDFSPISEAIVQRHRLDNSLAILQVGLPEEIAVNYAGGDLLTMLGERVSTGWKYSLILPETHSIDYGFVFQEGPNRGTVIILQ